MGDPAISVFYNVTIDGFIPLGFWTKVDGLGMEYEVFEYREGGVNGYMHKLVGPVKFTNLRLSRPVDATSPALMMWLQSNQMMVVPQTMAITAMTAAGEAITTWNLVGARAREVDRAVARRVEQQPRHRDARGRVPGDQPHRRAGERARRCGERGHLRLRLREHLVLRAMRW